MGTGGRYLTTEDTEGHGNAVGAGGGCSVWGGLWVGIKGW